MNSSEAIYKQKQLMAELIGCECFGVDDDSQDTSEYDKSIAEINAMIEHFIMTGNKTEVASWRRLLQETKTEKRHAKKMIESKDRMEPAYT